MTHKHGRSAIGLEPKQPVGNQSFSEETKAKNSQWKKDKSKWASELMWRDVYAGWLFGLAMVFTFCFYEWPFYITYPRIKKFFIKKKTQDTS